MVDNNVVIIPAGTGTCLRLAGRNGAVMTPEAERLDSLIVEVRTAFHRLKAVSDQMHRDLGITAAMRAVMETVADDGPMTVPQIARARGVSRQHIQTSVDSLAATGLVGLKENPAHRRSPLVVLTRRGKSVFREIRRRERAVLEALAGGLPARRITAARATLQTLNARLQPRMTGESDDD